MFLSMGLYMGIHGFSRIEFTSSKAVPRFLRRVSWLTKFVRGPEVPPRSQKWSQMGQKGFPNFLLPK